MTKKVTKATKTKPAVKKEVEIVKAALKPVTKTPVKQAKKPAAVKKEVKKPMPTKPALKKTNIKEVKTVEKAANPTPVVTKKAEPSSISFEDIKKHLLKPLPTIVPSFLRK